MDDDNVETTIFEEGQVKITNRRVDFGYATYELVNFASAELTSVDEPPALVHGIGYISVIIICFILESLHIESFLEFLKYGFYLCGSVILLLFLGAWLIPSNTSYRVYLKGESEMGVFKTYDKSQAQRIVDAINDAISRRERP